MNTVALALAVLEVGGSVSALGLVLAARFLPLAVLLLLGGVIADRVARRTLMLSADVVRASAQTALAWLLLTGTAGVPLLAVLAAVTGAAEAFFAPALVGYLPQVVAQGGLQRANAWLRGSGDTARVGGLALGGVLVLSVGTAGAVAVDALTYVASAAVLARLPSVARPVGARSVPARLSAAARWQGLLDDIAGGWREVRSRRWLWVSVANFTVFGAFAVPALLVLGPDLALTDLGGVQVWSWLLTATGAGALAGSTVAVWLRPARPALVVAGLLAVSGLRPAVYVTGLPLVALLGAAAVGGAALSAATVLWMTLLQERIPPAALSRVSAIDDVGTYLLTPAGYLLAGPVGLALGLHRGMLLLAVLAVGASLVTMATLSEGDPAVAVRPAVRDG